MKENRRMLKNLSAVMLGSKTDQLQICIPLPFQNDRISIPVSNHFQANDEHVLSTLVQTVLNMIATYAKLYGILGLIYGKTPHEVSNTTFTIASCFFLFLPVTKNTNNVNNNLTSRHGIVSKAVILNLEALCSPRHSLQTI